MSESGGSVVGSSNVAFGDAGLMGVWAGPAAWLWMCLKYSVIAQSLKKERRRERAGAFGCGMFSV